MAYMIARQNVENFATWKEVFDSHADAQEKAGLRVEKLLRNLDNANDVFVLFEVTNLDKARAFVTSPEVPAAKEESGVIGDTQIYFLG